MKPRSSATSRGLDIHGYSKSYSGKFSDESGDESVELPIRKKYKPQHFVEAVIQDGDTLQAIALRFDCTVSTIMRTNNILRENEIYARKSLKIPITAYSLLSETIPSVHKSGTNSPTKLSNSNSGIIKESPSKLLVSDDDFQQKLIVAAVNASEIKVARYSDTPPNQNVPSTSKNFNSISSSSIHIDEHLNDDLDDQTAPLLLEQNESPANIETVLIKEFTTKGADWGIKWIQLIVCILVLAFVIPLVYVIHIAEHPEKYHIHSNEHH